MERKRLVTLMFAMIVMGVLVGAAIAQTLLAATANMNYNVKSSKPLEWEKLGAPDTPLYRGVWYNTTVIDFNLTNTDNNQGYTLKNVLEFRATVSVVKANVKAAFDYRKQGSGWTGVYHDIEFATVWDSDISMNIAQGYFGNGLVINKAGTTGSWIEFKIRFWIADDAPTGAWIVSLVATDYFDYP
jgi:hypothetical protein